MANVESRKEPFQKQLKDHKYLITGIIFAVIMLLFAFLGARSDFLRNRKQSKPIPNELTKSLTPLPTNNKKSGECKITGCSGQICTEEEVVTTCEYKEIYSCYKTATCEVQDNGECGWTMNDQLSRCLQSFVGEPSL